MKTIEDVMLKAGCRILLERPDLMSLLGLVTANWSQVEEDMALLYAYILGQHGPPEEYGQPVDPLGVQIFFELPSGFQRIKLLSICIEARISDGFAQKFMSQVAKQIDRAAKFRNKLIHTRLGVSDAYPAALIGNPLVGETYLIEEKDFDEALNLIEDARIAIMKFHHEARITLNKPAS